jgi:hypothetical protein
MSEPKMKLNEVYEAAKEQDKRQLCRFMQDMRRAGLKQRVYHDNVSWSGPAVVCEDAEAVIAETKVPCLSVKKGQRFVVYPKQGL